MCSFWTFYFFIGVIVAFKVDRRRFFGGIGFFTCIMIWPLILIMLLLDW